MSAAGSREAVVIDLASSPEGIGRGHAPAPHGAGAAAARSSAARHARREPRVVCGYRPWMMAGETAGTAAAANNDVIELSSEGEDEYNLNGAARGRRQRRGKRDRNSHPSAMTGTGQLKDYDEDGRKVRAREDTNNDGLRVTGAEASVVDLIEDDINPPPAVAAATGMTTEGRESTVLPPELQVLEIYPDADEDNVKVLLQQYNQKIEVVVAVMAEKGYKTSNVNPNQRQGINGITVSMQKRKSWSYDFMSADSFTPSAGYIKQAKSQLLYDFHFLTSVGGDIILHKTSDHYAKAHDFVITILKGKGDEETKFSRLDGVMRGAEPSADQAQELNAHQKGKMGVVFRRRNRNKRAIPIVEDPVLLEEISYVHGKLDEYLRNGRKHESVERKKVAAQNSNTAVDCSCCYDGYDIDDMVACTHEGHLFCVDCLRSYAENQIFGVGNLGVDRKTKKPAYELKCFQGDCSSAFDRRSLEKALTQKTLEKYDSIQCALALQAAGIECMVECPKCQFQVELPMEHKVLVCPIESCKYESCRECGEAAHIPLRCEEVEKEQETKGRITVEEAISQAKIRKCPKCKKAFLKDSGCNKITCGCGHKICESCVSALAVDNRLESLMRALPPFRRLHLSGSDH